MFESHADLTIRRLSSADREAVERLAERDSAPVPSGSLLAAIAPGGAFIAAISLDTRDVVADPFLPSNAAVNLLRVRARQIAGDVEHGGRRRRRFRRRSEQLVLLERGHRQAG